MVTVHEGEGYWVEVYCDTGDFLFSRVDVGLVQPRVIFGGDGKTIPEEVEFALENHGYALCCRDTPDVRV